MKPGRGVSNVPKVKPHLLLVQPVEPRRALGLPLGDGLQGDSPGGAEDIFSLKLDSRRDIYYAMQCNGLTRVHF